LPTDRTVDGRDITPLLLDPAATTPHEAFFYYFMNDLEAVRSGRWKLHFAKRREPLHALYDIEADPGETVDVAAEHPDVVAELEAHAERARTSLGDRRLRRFGDDVRPVGRVDHPRTLSTYDPAHPYYMAEYDLPHRG